MDSQTITTLFLDVGGVLASNGWDHTMRRDAANRFGLDYDEMNDRHHLTFDTYEEGRLSLDEYLDRVVFHRPREFTRQDFLTFMYAQSEPRREAIEYFRDLKQRHGLTVAAVSNEGRELTEYRIRKFDLMPLFDCYLASAFVGRRKPDLLLYRLALDVVQARPDQVAYVDDRLMYVEVASSLGIHGIQHSDLATTREALAGLGLALE